MADPAILIEQDLIKAKIERLRKDLLHATADSQPSRAASRSKQGARNRSTAKLEPLQREVNHSKPVVRDAFDHHNATISPAELARSNEEHMNKKILLVDNNRDYLNSLADYLETVGYEVYRAETIDRARQLLDYIWCM